MGIGTRCAPVLRGELVETSHQTMGVSGKREDKARASEVMQHITQAELRALVNLKARAAGMRDWQGRTCASRERDLGKASAQFTVPQLLFHQPILARHPPQTLVPSHSFLFPSLTVPYQTDIINQGDLLHHRVA